jgi:hypothetical protein
MRAIIKNVRSGTVEYCGAIAHRDLAFPSSFYISQERSIASGSGAILEGRTAGSYHNWLIAVLESFAAVLSSISGGFNAIASIN